MPDHCALDQVVTQVARRRRGVGKSVLLDHFGHGQLLWLWRGSASPRFYFVHNHSVSASDVDCSVRLFVPKDFVEVSHETIERLLSYPELLNISKNGAF